MRQVPLSQQAPAGVTENHLPLQSPQLPELLGIPPVALQYRLGRLTHEVLKQQARFGQALLQVLPDVQLAPASAARQLLLGTKSKQPYREQQAPSMKPVLTRLAFRRQLCLPTTERARRGGSRCSTKEDALASSKCSRHAPS